MIRPLLIALFTLGGCSALATEPTTSPATKMGENTANEPLVKEYSLTKATEFLDTAATRWTQEHQCFTCHTNFAYLMARPNVSADSDAHREVRHELEAMVEKRWESDGPRWDAEVVMAAAVLAINDSKTTQRLHDTTRKALSRMWTLQRPDGGFSWLKCDWPPMESDDDYGISIAAMALSFAPEEYRKTEEAQRGLHGLKSYLKSNPPPTLHHQAMLLWAEKGVLELLTSEQRAACIEGIVANQKADGGWAVATFGNWKRVDGTEQDTTHSDGYATGLAILVLRSGGYDPTSPILQRGIQWLKVNQRESGRWFTRSLHKDSTHYLSHAGSAMAVMALTECENNP